MRLRHKNETIRTLLPHQCVAGDAIRYSLLAVKHKQPHGTFLYDILMSASTESQLWHNLWRVPRTTQNKKIGKIILPLNIPKTHWYVAILHLDKMGVKLNIQNDIKMRDKELKLT